MNRDLHHNDDLYRKAHERMEEEPSVEVWNKVVAKLDNRDAWYYQQKAIHWKRTSLLLLLLLGAVLITGTFYVIADNKKQHHYTQAEAIHTLANYEPNVLQFSSDSGAFPANRTHTPTDVVTQNTKSNTDTAEAILYITSAQPVNANAKQTNAYAKKPFLKPLQHSSASEQTTIAKQQAVSTSNMAHIAKKAAQKEIIVEMENAAGKEITGRLQKNRTKPQSTYNPNASDDSCTLSKHQQHFGFYQTDDVAFSKGVPLTLPFALLNHFSPNALAKKESVDSNILAKVLLDTLEELGQKATEGSGSRRNIKVALLSNRRFQLTGFTSVDFVEYRLRDNRQGRGTPPSSSQQDDRRKIKEGESHGVSFSLGLTVRWLATKDFSLKSGISYSGNTINTKPQTLYVAPTGSRDFAYKLVTSSGYAYIKSSRNVSIGDSAKAGFSQQRLRFLSIPLMAGYTLYNSRHFSIIPSFGVAANFVISTNLQTEISEPATASKSVQVTQLNGLCSLYPSSQVDAEIQYHFKRNMSLLFLPSVRYAVSPLARQNAVNTSPCIFSLGTGFIYHF